MVVVGIGNIINRDEIVYYVIGYLQAFSGRKILYRMCPGCFEMSVPLFNVFEQRFDLFVRHVFFLCRCGGIAVTDEGLLSSE